MPFHSYTSKQRKSKKNTIRERDGDYCALCKKLMDFSLVLPDPDAVTFDHIVSSEDGGKDNNENLQLAHFRCNQEKSHVNWRVARHASLIPIE